MLNWVNLFNIFCFLDNHQYESPHHTHECLLAAGAIDSLATNSHDAFNELKQFSNKHEDWLFGHFGYDLKNEIEYLFSENADHIKFPDLFFFIPEIVIELSGDKISIGVAGNRHQAIFARINETIVRGERTGLSKETAINSRYSKESYLSTINALKRHILRGDCYEINFCQEFFVEHVILEPLAVYTLLNAASPNPFSAFYKINDKFAMCASPERYLKKAGDRILSQPIKGTWKKNLENPVEDDLNKEQFYGNKKERAENVMIVDLVRNDFSKICKEGSVIVNELFGIYTFPNLHHMISSITGELRGDVHWVDIIRATFPMGSMTGAPKKNVMRLIEQYEKTKRGIFSGAIGYVSPERDFDFNVVIRTILFNASARYLSFLVGSGITFYSDAENEYDECLLKAAAIKKVLTF